MDSKPARDMYKSLFKEASIRLPGFSYSDAYWGYNLYSPQAPLTRTEAFRNIAKGKRTSASNRNKKRR